MTHNQSTKTVTITVTVPDNYEWDEKQLRFRELINEPVDKADLTNAKVGDVYETNYGEKGCTGIHKRTERLPLHLPCQQNRYRL